MLNNHSRGTLLDPFLKRCKKTGRVVGVSWQKWYAKLLFPVVGVVALLWFLIRVIPKPSRITYPCQQVALSVAGGYWLTAFGVFAGLTALIKSKLMVRRNLFMIIVATAVITVVTVVVSYSSSLASAGAGAGLWVGPEGPNQPMGEGTGLFPGRVVWVRNTASTRWDGQEKSWWDDDHTDQQVVSEMFSTMLRTYTGTTDDKAAWDAVFRYHNRLRQRGDVAYRPGEKVVIKINSNHDKKSYNWDNEAHPSPAVIYALVAQLIDVVGMAGQDITIAEPSQLIGNPIYNKIRKNPNPEYQQVRFVDRGGPVAAQRFSAEPDPDCGIYFTIPDEQTKTFTKKVKFELPKCYTKATYLINLSILRGHRVFGVTLCSKNHFGSIYSPELKLFKPGEAGSLKANRIPTAYMLHSFSLWDYPASNKLGQPSFSPTMLGHKDLGQKELLYLVDGIFTSKLNEKGMIRFESLDNDWCSSLFISQDPVALQSVGTDILGNETNVTADNPSFTPDLDNFLRESALAHHPPSGFRYDPEDDGTFIDRSLGVHEHWNNPVEKKYSRNLGKAEGIELIMVNQ